MCFYSKIDISRSCATENGPLGCKGDENNMHCVCEGDMCNGANKQGVYLISAILAAFMAKILA